MSRQFPALRGLAILLVVVNHSITLTLQAIRQSSLAPLPRWQTSLLVAVKNLGLVAVPIFLFLSGAYVVYATRGKALGAAYRNVILGLRYVLTAYLLWSIVFYGLVYLLDGETYSVIGYVRNLIVGYPFNFVPILIFFYLLSPLLVRSADRWPLSFLAVVFIYQLFSANVMAPGILGFEFPGWTRWLTIPGLRLSLAIWAIFFPLGVVHGLRTDEFTDFVRRSLPALLVLTMLGYVGSVLHDLSLSTVAIAELLFPVLAIFFAPAVGRDRIPAAAWLENLGRMAYGLYLT
ncbi:MAG: acyltransferase family protein, partial [Anaerolineales bacterium]